MQVMQLLVAKMEAKQKQSDRLTNEHKEALRIALTKLQNFAGDAGGGENK